jgi:hypothetical protein
VDRHENGKLDRDQNDADPQQCFLYYFEIELRLFLFPLFDIFLKILNKFSNVQMMSKYTEETHHYVMASKAEMSFAGRFLWCRQRYRPALLPRHRVIQEK